MLGNFLVKYIFKPAPKLFPLKKTINWRKIRRGLISKILELKKNVKH